MARASLQDHTQTWGFEDCKTLEDAKKLVDNMITVYGQEAQLKMVIMGKSSIRTVVQFRKRLETPALVIKPIKPGNAP